MLFVKMYNLIISISVAKKLFTVFVVIVESSYLYCKKHELNNKTTTTDNGTKGKSVGVKILN